MRQELSKIQITHENYPIIKDVLPPTAHELIAVIGLDKALILLNDYAGKRLPLTNGLRNTEQSRLLREKLDSIIGKDAAEKIILSIFQHYEHRIFIVPKCKDARARLRDMAILKDYDEMARQGISDLKIVDYLQEKYDLSIRSIRYSIKRSFN